MDVEELVVVEEFVAVVVCSEFNALVSAMKDASGVV